MIRLEQPHIRFKESFLKAMDEFLAEGRWQEFDENFIRQHFSDFVQEYIDHSKGRKIPMGYVPHTMYWIIDSNDQYVGQIDLRHKINAALRCYGGHIGYEIRPSERKKGYGKMALKEVLIKAKKLELNKVLVTCDSDNIASRKIIETNKGILNDEREQKDGTHTLCFWIEL